MMKSALASLLTLGLVACATQPPKAPPTPTASSLPLAPKPSATQRPPSEAAAEAVRPVSAAELVPVPFEVSRARFVRDTAAKYGIAPATIEATLAQAEFRDSIVALMAKPAERVKPWSDYRTNFITATRIDGGRAFLAQHQAELARVQQRTGVPAEIIVAIIGVETSYGGFTGKTRILDALYTLGFRYPRSGDPMQVEREYRREQFFRDELGQLFALAREEGLDITTLTGSYAGAMGLGQFMPSSYRQFAVDGDGDGKRNLFTDYDDVFASIANYFIAKGGWQPGGPIAVQARLAAGREPFEPTTWTPDYSLADLAAKGYATDAALPGNAMATVVNLQGSTGPQQWLGFQNYYAITRYNNSKMYALAVFQLAEAIAGRPVPDA